MSQMDDWIPEFAPILEPLIKLYLNANGEEFVLCQ
jgi:hypothetical protein